MRVVLFLGAFVVAFALAPASSASMFGELPGMDIAERATKGEVAKFEGGETTHQFEESGSATGSSRSQTSSDGTSEATSDGSDGETFITDLPGGETAFLGDPTGSGGPSTLPMLAIAAFVVVCFTRFLFRLNHVH